MKQIYYNPVNYYSTYSFQPQPIPAKSSKRKIFLIMFIISIICVGVSLGIYYSNKKQKEEQNERESKNEKIIEKEEPLIISNKERSRISLLQECMKAYNIKNFPELDEGINNNQSLIINNKILSISTLEMNIKKGEKVEIFKGGFDLEPDEYACISYDLNENNYMTKIPDGQFYLPNDFSGDINETPFTFILYFNYDPSINEINSTDSEDINRLLDLYDDKNNKGLARRLSIFYKIKNFFKKNVKKIVEKVVEKTVSFACVSLVKFCFQELYDPVIKGVSEYACDELGEFAGKGVSKLIFNSHSKPAENYKQIIYEESIENNYNTYPLNIFSISYINNKLKNIKDENYIEIKGDDYNKYASNIIPPEQILTKHNHIFNPLGNLILAELSSAYLKPILINNNYDPDIHFFRQYKFEWTYTGKYDKKEDHSDINTFLVNDKYVLFNNKNCSDSENEFYIAIQKIGEPIIKIFKNPEYIYLEKNSDFKAAFWIRNVKSIYNRYYSCFHFNNLYPFSNEPIENMLQHYVYGYKKINLAEYNISDIFSFSDFITFTPVEYITMPFYSTDDGIIINRFISNNYRLKNINWNDISIKSKHVKEFISYTPLGGINLDMKFLKGAQYLYKFFYFDDLRNNNIKNFDTSHVTHMSSFLANTTGSDIEFIKNFDTSELQYISFFISNNDIVKLDIGIWNKNKLIDLAFAFSKCKSLKYIDLSGNIIIQEDMDFAGMLYISSSVKAINIKGWDFSCSQCIDNIFYYFFGEDNIFSSVMIYIDENMYNHYFEVIKKFIGIKNNSQYTISTWPY